MDNIAEVRIWNNLVGAVYWNSSRGYASFEYEPKFLKLGYDLAPIMMPLEQALTSDKIFNFPQLNFETYNGLPGMLADSLPDRYGTQLINRWLAEQGREVDSINPIERLCYTGQRGMGALEYKPATEIHDDESKSIEIDRLVRLASEVLVEKTQLQANMNRLDADSLLEIIKVGTSAGGARAKAIIAYNKNTGDIRSGQIDNLAGYDYWIIKLDGVTDEQLGNSMGFGKIEYAYYQMAKDCGINMAECDLKRESDRAHFMTKRFDRRGQDKIHMQSLCGIAHYDYNQAQAYSYEQAFQVIRRLSLPYTDSEEFFKRMCFNIVARNQDDHTKNISFLMDKDGQWMLSPAYDMTYAYNPGKKWNRYHQMTINGKSEEITRDDIIQLAIRMNIKKPNNIIEKTIEVVSKWPEYAKYSDVDKLKMENIKRNLLLKI